MYNTLSLLENVEHCGGEPEQADTGYYVIDERCNNPPACTSIYHSQGALKGFLLALNVKC